MLRDDLEDVWLLWFGTRRYASFLVPQLLLFIEDLDGAVVGVASDLVVRVEEWVELFLCGVVLGPCDLLSPYAGLVSLAEISPAYENSLQLFADFWYTKHFDGSISL